MTPRRASPHGLVLVLDVNTENGSKIVATALTVNTKNASPSFRCAATTGVEPHTS